MKIALVFGNDGSDVRVGKVCRSLSLMCYDLNFVGWDRRPEDKKTIDIGNAKRHIMSYATPNGKVNFKGEVQYFLHVFKTLKKIRPNVVCSVNEDFTALLVPFRGFLYKYLVCDVFDALVDRQSYRPWWFRAILHIFSEVARMGADKLIVTDEYRYQRFGRYKRKCIIIGNYPEDPGELYASVRPMGPIKIYVAGTLFNNRGLDQILQVVIKNDNVKIISAGWVFDQSARNFVNHPKVDFRGIVTAKQSLALASQCDAVYSFYAPISKNNIFASPNKIYDAIAVGRPIIINSEALVSHWVEKNTLGWTCMYNDFEALDKIVKNLVDYRVELSLFSVRARNVFLSGYTWQIMEKKLNDLYASFQP